MLVGKRGGLPALQMPELALGIARSAMVHGSLRLERPRFPCSRSLDADAPSAYQ